MPLQQFILQPYEKKIIKMLFVANQSRSILDEPNIWVSYSVVSHHVFCYTMLAIKSTNAFYWAGKFKLD